MAGAAQPAPERRPRVLVAEDDPALRRLLDLRLRMDGFDVDTTEDGVQALEVALGAMGRPDILVCDIMMPRLSGLTVCRRLRENAATADMPIILLSARTVDSAIEEVVALGNVTFMNKPFNAVDLRERIQEVLDGRAAAKVE